MDLIDLNCDMGEGFGVYNSANDVALLKHVSSANIACGFHAGDPAIMHNVVKLAIENNVAIGAHPGLPDLQGFGRRKIKISPNEAYQLTLYQVGALAGFVKAGRGWLHHVKPHGALYNMAADDPDLAEAIARAVYDFDPRLVLYGLAGSELITAGTTAGLKVAREAFADRTYLATGKLAPRSDAQAIIHDESVAFKQVWSILKNKMVESADGTQVSLAADTFCIHGDHKNAVVIAEYIANELIANEVIIQAPAQP